MIFIIKNCKIIGKLKILVKIFVDEFVNFVVLNKNPCPLSYNFLCSFLLDSRNLSGDH